MSIFGHLLGRLLRFALSLLGVFPSSGPPGTFPLRAPRDGDGGRRRPLLNGDFVKRPCHF